MKDCKTYIQVKYSDMNCVQHIMGCTQYSKYNLAFKTSIDTTYAGKVSLAVRHHKTKPKQKIYY